MVNTVNKLASVVAGGYFSNVFCSINGSEYPNNAYCIFYNGNIWEVYYCKKGRKLNLRWFDNEEDVCDYFLKLIFGEIMGISSGDIITILVNDSKIYVLYHILSEKRIAIYSLDGTLLNTLISANGIYIGYIVENPVYGVIILGVEEQEYKWVDRQYVYDNGGLTMISLGK